MKRANNFDAIRFVLASAVIFSHAWPVTSNSETGEPFHTITRGGLTIGDFAVDAFFVLSGYLVAASWERSSGVVDFMRKRVRRIYPGFFLMSAVTACVVVPLFGDFHGYSRRDVATIVFDALNLTAYGFPYGNLPPVFVHNTLPYAVNQALWTVRYEFLCYAFLGLLGLVGTLRRKPVILASILAVVWAAYVFEPTLPSHRILTATIGGLSSYPRFLTYFLGGALCWRIAFRPSKAMLLVSAVALACALPFALPLRVALPLALPTLLLGLGALPGRLNAFGRYGDFSYGIYIYGFIAQQIVSACLGSSSPYTNFLVAWPLAVVAGIASWYAVERRWLARTRGQEPVPDPATVSDPRPI